MIRFSISPTHEMNISELRLALLNYIVAKQRAEDFIVRLEDLDKNSVLESAEKDVLGILELFGVKYTQVIHQSDNVRFHSAMALQLMHEKKHFHVFVLMNGLRKRKKRQSNKKKIINMTMHVQTYLQNL